MLFCWWIQNLIAIISHIIIIHLLHSLSSPGFSVVTSFILLLLGCEICTLLLLRCRVVTSFILLLLGCEICTLLLLRCRVVTSFILLLLGCEICTPLLCCIRIDIFQSSLFIRTMLCIILQSTFVFDPLLPSIQHPTQPPPNSSAQSQLPPQHTLPSLQSQH